MTCIVRYVPFLFLSSLGAMDAQKSIEGVSYTILIDELIALNLSPRATEAEKPQRIKERIDHLILSLKESGVMSLDGIDSTSELIHGQNLRDNSKTIVCDFAAYCALLCFEKESAGVCFRQDLHALSEERVLVFFPRLFCLAVYRKCFSLAYSILTAARNYFTEKGADSRESIRTYFFLLLPVFFLIDESDTLIQACAVLGANYLLPEEVALLLNVREGNADILIDYASVSNAQAYEPFLKALLLGCCMKRSKNSRELVTLIMSKLYMRKRKPTAAFLCLLQREAETADNGDVVDYIEAFSFVESAP